MYNANFLLAKNHITRRCFPDYTVRIQIQQFQLQILAKNRQTATLRFLSMTHLKLLESTYISSIFTWRCFIKSRYLFIDISDFQRSSFRPQKRAFQCPRIKISMGYVNKIPIFSLPFSSDVDQILNFCLVLGGSVVIFDRMT